MPQFNELPNDPTPDLDDLVALQAATGGPGSSYHSTLAQLLTFAVLVDGSQGLTDDWDAGPHEIRAEQLYADIATGTAPILVNSTTVCTNLNADLCDGQHLGTDSTPRFSGLQIGSSGDGFAGLTFDIVSSGMAGTFYTGVSAANRFQYLCRKARGTASVPVVVESADAVGILAFSAYDGSAFQQAAQVQCTVDGDVSSGNVPMRLSFVTGSNASNRTERLYIKNDGNIQFNTSTTPTSATFNLVVGGPTTSPVLGAATADAVAIAAVDNGAGNRELQVQPESGGLFALGNNRFRRVPSSTRDVEHLTASVTTTDGTQTTLATIPIAANYTYQIEASIVARRTGGASGTADDGASYRRIATYTTKSGTVTVMGSVQTLGTDSEDQGGWDVTFTISGSNVLVRVTGAASNNITWFGDVSIRRVSS